MGSKASCIQLIHMIYIKMNKEEYFFTQIKLYLDSLDPSLFPAFYYNFVRNSIPDLPTFEGEGNFLEGGDIDNPLVRNSLLLFFLGIYEFGFATVVKTADEIASSITPDMNKFFLQEVNKFIGKITENVGHFNLLNTNTNLYEVVNTLSQASVDKIFGKLESLGLFNILKIDTNNFKNYSDLQNAVIDALYSLRTLNYSETFAAKVTTIDETVLSEYNTLVFSENVFANTIDNVIPFAPEIRFWFYNFLTTLDLRSWAINAGALFALSLLAYGGYRLAWYWYYGAKSFAKNPQAATEDIINEAKNRATASTLPETNRLIKDAEEGQIKSETKQTSISGRKRRLSVSKTVQASVAENAIKRSSSKRRRKSKIAGGGEINLHKEFVNALQGAGVFCSIVSVSSTVLVIFLTLYLFYTFSYYFLVNYYYKNSRVAIFHKEKIFEYFYNNFFEEIRISGLEFIEKYFGLDALEQILRYKALSKILVKNMISSYEGIVVDIVSIFSGTSISKNFNALNKKIAFLNTPSFVWVVNPLLKKFYSLFIDLIYDSYSKFYKLVTKINSLIYDFCENDYQSKEIKITNVQKKEIAKELLSLIKV